MSLAIGSKSALTFKEETVYGTAPTGNWQTMSFNSETLQQSINTFVSNAIRSDRTVPNVRGGNISAGGTITVELYIQKLGKFFQHLTCATDSPTTITQNALAASTPYLRGDIFTSNGQVFMVTVAGTTAASIAGGFTLTAAGTQTLFGITAAWTGLVAITMYKHIYKNGIDLPTGGLSFEKYIGGGTTNSYFQFLGGRVDKFNLTIPQTGICTASMDLLFQNSAASTTSIAGTPTFTADDPAVGYEAVIAINTVVQTVAKSATLQISNNLDQSAFVIGNRYRNSVPTGQRQVTGTVNVYFQDLTQYNLFLNETVIPIQISLITDGMYLLFDMPECKLTGGQASPQISGNGTVEATFNFQAFHNAGSYDISIELRNTTASY